MNKSDSLYQMQDPPEEKAQKEQFKGIFSFKVQDLYVSPLFASFAIGAKCVFEAANTNWGMEIIHLKMWNPHRGMAAGLFSVPDLKKGYLNVRSPPLSAFYHLASL